MTTIPNDNILKGKCPACEHVLTETSTDVYCAGCPDFSMSLSAYHVLLSGGRVNNSRTSDNGKNRQKARMAHAMEIQRSERRLNLERMYRAGRITKAEYDSKVTFR